MKVKVKAILKFTKFFLFEKKGEEIWHFRHRISIFMLLILNIEYALWLQNMYRQFFRRA
jgi:hypothetical protein